MTQHTRSSIGRNNESESTASATTTTKTRRSHRKSRNGCIECKHRHIRCDEHKPVCANCEAAERLCAYPQIAKTRSRRGQRLRAKQKHQADAETAPSPGSEASGNNARITETTHEKVVVLESAATEPQYHEVPAPASQHQSRSSFDSLPYITYLNVIPDQIPSPASPQADYLVDLSIDCCPGLASVPIHAPKAVFTPQHMILLHHASNVPNFSGRNRNVVDIAVRYAVDSPYLIDEILAFTAFHISHQYPGSATYLQRLATELQTRALTSFTRTTQTVAPDDEPTAVPRYLFSGILGRHVLADTLTHCYSDFHFFIDRFVECINLNRGIRSVTPLASTWEHLYNSEIQPFFTIVMEAEAKIGAPGNECDFLVRLMDKSDLNESSVKACRQAITTLQWAFDLCHNLDEEEYPQAASAFSVRIDAGYTQVLRKHQPEALVILAYFAVILCRCRSYWPFAKAGPTVIRSIASRLGSYWQEALAWPLRVLETECESEPQFPNSVGTLNNIADQRY